MAKERIENFQAANRRLRVRIEIRRSSPGNHSAVLVAGGNCGFLVRLRSEQALGFLLMRQVRAGRDLVPRPRRSDDLGD
jgi:hypothetical protein